MGIFPHFFSGSPLTHITHLVLPGLPLLTQSIKAVTPLVSKGIQELHTIGSFQTTPKNAQPEHVGPVTYGTPSGSYLQPSQYQPPPLYGPSPFTPTPYTYQPTQDTFSPYGGPSWGSSTISPAYSTPQYQTFSAAAPQTQDRSWEDLTLAALPLFL